MVINMLTTAHSHAAYKRRIYALCFSMETPVGKVISLFWGMMTLLSVGLVFLSMGGLGFTYQNPDFYHHTELFFVAFFSFEYLIRLWVTPPSCHYPSSAMGIIDLVTTISLLVVVLFPDVVTHYGNFIRLLRILCILRLFKLLGFIDDMAFFRRCINRAKSKLLLFLICIAIVAVMSGGIMYVLEGPANGFTNLGTSVYWAIVTIATVGYGDITPHTALGRMIASVLIIIGYLSLAIPTSILSAYVISERDKSRSHPCPVCERKGHEPDAKFCKYCGSGLGR